MRILGFEVKRAFVRTAPPHALTDEEREMGMEVRRMKQAERRVQHEIELLKLETAKLELEVQKNDLLAELGDEEEDGLESIFSGFLKNAAARVQQSQTPTPSPAAAPQQHYTDDELVELKKKIPATVLQYIRTKSDDELVTLARERYPDIFNALDEDTKRRALVILKQ